MLINYILPPGVSLTHQIDSRILFGAPIQTEYRTQSHTKFLQYDAIYDFNFECTVNNPTFALKCAQILHAAYF